MPTIFTDLQSSQRLHSCMQYLTRSRMFSSRCFELSLYTFKLRCRFAIPLYRYTVYPVKTLWPVTEYYTGIFFVPETGMRFPIPNRLSSSAVQCVLFGRDYVVRVFCCCLFLLKPWKWTNQPWAADPAIDEILHRGRLDSSRLGLFWGNFLFSFWRKSHISFNANFF